MKSIEIFLSLLTNITFKSEDKWLCYNVVSWISETKAGSVLKFSCSMPVYSGNIMCIHSVSRLRLEMNSKSFYVRLGLWSTILNTDHFT